jgi:hypothetical protein
MRLVGSPNAVAGLTPDRSSEPSLPPTKTALVPNVHPTALSIRRLRARNASLDDPPKATKTYRYRYRYRYRHRDAMTAIAADRFSPHQAPKAILWHSGASFAGGWHVAALSASLRHRRHRMPVGDRWRRGPRETVTTTNDGATYTVFRPRTMQTPESCVVGIIGGCRSAGAR